MNHAIAIVISFVIMISCQSKKNFVVNSENVKAGTSVFKGKVFIKLHEGQFNIGDNLNNLLEYHFKKRSINKVTVINIVPSIDTPVCEGQTHSLGESKLLNKNIGKITISRDLPMAQNRFAKEANLENIEYFSDYKSGAFGKATGLLMQGNELLARAVVVTDSDGIIKYIQIVSNITELPDMKKAFLFANELLAKGAK